MSPADGLSVYHLLHGRTQLQWRWNLGPPPTPKPAVGVNLVPLLAHDFVVLFAVRLPGWDVFKTSLGIEALYTFLSFSPTVFSCVLQFYSGLDTKYPSLIIKTLWFLYILSHTLHSGAFPYVLLKGVPLRRGEGGICPPTVSRVEPDLVVFSETKEIRRKFHDSCISTFHTVPSYSFKNSQL